VQTALEGYYHTSISVVANLEKRLLLRILFLKYILAGFFYVSGNSLCKCHTKIRNFFKKLEKLQILKTAMV